MQETQEFKPVDPTETFASTGGKEYLPAPTKKLLKFHVGPFETTEQINNFKTTPSGEENPDFGKPQPILIFKGILDEGEAAGQVYSSWITGYYKDGKAVYAMGDRSKLGKIAEAICESVEAFKATPAGQLEGLPFQCALKPGTKNPERLLLDIDKIMPPADDQVRVPTDEEIEQGVLDAIAKA